MEDKDQKLPTARDFLDGLARRDPRVASLLSRAYASGLPAEAALFALVVQLLAELDAVVDASRWQATFAAVAVHEAKLLGRVSALKAALEVASPGHDLLSQPDVWR